MRNTIFFVVTLLVLVAGVYFGKKDFEDERRRVPPVGATPAPIDDATGDSASVDGRGGSTAPADDPEPDRPPPPPEPEGPAPGDVLAVVSDLEADMVELGAERVSRAAEKELEGYLEDFKSDFRRKPALAGALDPLRRFASKSKVFAALIDPIAREDLPDPIHEVELTNGNSILAGQIQKVGEKYQVTTVRPKGTAGLPVGNVARVKTMSRAEYLEALSKEITSAVAKLDSPIDLYLKGVTPSFRRGLDALGYEILEKLLANSSSRQVPAIFAYDPDGTLVASWEVAAKRRELPMLAFGGQPEPLSAVGTTARRSRAPDAPVGSVQRSVQEVRQLYERARQTYQDVVVRRIKEDKALHGARDDLDRAAAILDTLTSSAADHPEVQRAKADVLNLRNAVIKALPF